MIEKEYENLRSYCFNTYRKTNLNYRLEFEDFFNDFIVYILSYDLIQPDNFWQCIKRQLKRAQRLFCAFFVYICAVLYPLFLSILTTKNNNVNIFALKYVCGGKR